MLGAFGDAEPINDEVKQMALDFKGEIEKELNEKYDTFEPVSFKTQVVAGTNYLIKIKVGENKFIAAKIFKPLPCNSTKLELLEAEK